MRFETRKLENEEMIISYAEQQLQFYYYNSSVGIGELVHSTRFLLDYVAFAFQKKSIFRGRKRERMKVKLCIGFPNLEWSWFIIHQMKGKPNPGTEALSKRESTGSQGSIVPHKRHILLYSFVWIHKQGAEGGAAQPNIIATIHLLFSVVYTPDPSLT